MHVTESVSRLATVHDFPRWRHKDVLLARHSGLILRRAHARFRPGCSEAEFLAVATVVTPASWGWHFTNLDHSFDGMAHRYMSLSLRPAIHRHFWSVDCFVFHLFDRVPKIHAWLDAEYVEELDALAIYGAGEMQP